jgi:hypothetical protein
MATTEVNLTEKTSKTCFTPQRMEERPTRSRILRSSRRYKPRNTPQCIDTRLNNKTKLFYPSKAQQILPQIPYKDIIRS